MAAKVPAHVDGQRAPQPVGCQRLLDRDRRRTEPTLVADHQLHTVHVGGFHHVVAVGDRNRHGFLAKDVAAGGGRIHHDVAVRGMWRHYRHGVAVARAQKRSVVGPERNVAFTSQSFGLDAVGVGHADNLDLGLAINELGGIRAESSGAHETQPDAGIVRRNARHAPLRCISAFPHGLVGAQVIRHRV